MNPPAFQWYAADWLAGTIAMTPAQKGGYADLLSVQWEQFGLPNDDKILAKISGIRGRDLDIVKAKFQVCDDGKLRNARLERERAKQDAYREKQSLKGRASAQARFNRGSTAVQPEHQPDRQPDGQPDGQPEHQPDGQPDGQPEGNSPVSSLQSPSGTRTHGSAQPASEKEAAEWADMEAVPKEFAIDVFNQVSARGWLDGAGLPILSWRRYIKQRFSKSQKAKPEQHGRESKSTRSLSPLDVKTIIAAKQQKCDELKNQHAAEGPMETTWDDDSARKKFFALRKEIKELNERLGGMA